MKLPFFPPSASTKARPGPAGRRGLGEVAAIGIRLAGPQDLASLRRLVGEGRGGTGARYLLLDLGKPGTPRRVLIASVGGKDVAALHADWGHEARDPLEPTAAALELLRTRARQLRSRRRSRRARWLIKRPDVV